MNKFDCLYLTFIFNPFIFNHSYTLFISICMLKVCLYRTNFSLLLSRILVYDVGIIVNIKSKVPQICTPNDALNMVVNIFVTDVILALIITPLSSIIPV